MILDSSFEPQASLVTTPEWYLCENPRYSCDFSQSHLTRSLRAISLAMIFTLMLDFYVEFLYYSRQKMNWLDVLYEICRF